MLNIQIVIFYTKGDFIGLLQTFKRAQNQKRLHAAANSIYPAHTSGAIQQVRKRKA